MQPAFRRASIASEYGFLHWKQNSLSALGASTLPSPESLGLGKFDLEAQCVNAGCPDGCDHRWGWGRARVPPKGAYGQITPSWPEADLGQVTSDMLRRGLVASHLRPGLS